MNLIKSHSPNGNLSEVQYKFCVPEEYEKKEQERLERRVRIYNNPIHMVFNNHFAFKNPVCPHCGTRHVVKNDFNPKKCIDMKTNEKTTIYLQRYKCRECGGHFQTKMPEEYDCDENTYFTHSIKEDIHYLASEIRIPLRKISRFIKRFYKINISHETIRQYLMENDDLTYRNENAELSGYYGYDAQLVLVDAKYVPKNQGVRVKNNSKRKYIYRLSLFDLITNTVIAEKISFTETAKDIEKFIDETIPCKDRKAIVTDLNPEYDKVMRDLGFIHQGCEFHLSKLINKSISDKIKILPKTLKQSNPDKNKTEINKLVKNEKKEINDWISWFWGLFKQENINDALNFVEEIRSKLNTAPTIVKEVLNDKFMPHYRKFLHFLEKPHIGKLDSTNNKIENFFGTTLTKSDKKKLRTPQGIATQTHHSIKHWNERNHHPLNS